MIDMLKPTRRALVEPTHEGNYGIGLCPAANGGYDVDLQQDPRGNSDKAI